MFGQKFILPLIGLLIIGGGLATAQNTGTVTKNAIPYGKGPGVSGFGSITPLTDGQVIVGTTGAPPNSRTLNGDCALNSFAAINCTKTGGVAFKSGATSTNVAANILDYGAVVNTNTGAAATANAAAFVNAFSVNTHVVCPAGLTFYTESIVVPITAKRIDLNCNLIAAGTYGAAVGLLEIQNNVTGLVVQGGVNSSITLSGAYTATNSAIRCGTCNAVVFDGLNINGGFYSIQMVNTTSSNVRNNIISNYGVIGIAGSIANTNLSIRSNILNAGLTGSSHGIAVETDTNLIVEGNTITGARTWSISVQGVSGGLITGNRSSNSRREAIVTSGSNATISNNVLTYNNSSLDLGMSFENLTASTIQGNLINGPTAPCVYLGIGVQSVNVLNNTCIAPTRRAVTGAANNGAGGVRLTVSSTAGLESGDAPVGVEGIVGTTEANGAWIITVVDATHLDIKTFPGNVPVPFVNAYVSGGLVGDTDFACVALYFGTYQNTIANNSCRDFSGTMKYFVKEFSVPLAQGNRVINNVGDPPLSYATYVQSNFSYVVDPVGTTFANLSPAAANGSQVYVTDGLRGSAPLAGGGTGTWAHRVNGAWISGEPSVSGADTVVPRWLTGSLVASALQSSATEVGITGAPLSGRTLTLNSSGQPTFAFFGSGGGAGNKALGWLYDPQVSLAAPGLVVQTLSDAGAFVSNNAVFWRDGSITIGSISKAAAGSIMTAPVLVANLPACNATAEGSRMYVVDSNTGTFGVAVAGGGAFRIPVYCNSASWVAG